MISLAAIASQRPLKEVTLAISLGSEPKVGKPGRGDANLPPAMDRGQRRVGQPRYGRGAAQSIDDVVGDLLHIASYATFADTSQADFCDNRDCDSRRFAHQQGMTTEDIISELRLRNMTQRDLAQAIGMDENHLTKALKGKRQFKVPEMDAIRVELAPPPEIEGRLPVRSIPLLGDVPAGSYQPQEQKGGRRLIVSDPDLPINAYGLTVRGDSMDLIVPDGSTVIIDPADRKLWPGYRYVVRSADGETTFKEYQEGPARLVPCSSNPAHVDIPLGAEPVTIEGRVVSYTMRDVPRRRA